MVVKTVSVLQELLFEALLEVHKQGKELVVEAVYVLQELLFEMLVRIQQELENPKSLTLVAVEESVEELGQELLG
jgi:hypothetical protein